MKKRVIYLLIVVLLSFLSSILFEIFFINHEVLSKKSDTNPKIIDKKDIEFKNGYYTTTSKDSYIVLKIKNNYINKIKFDYKYKSNFSWMCSYKYNNKTVKINKLSSYVTNTAIKKIDKNISELKINFYNKNIRIKNITIDNSIFIYWNRVFVLTLILSVFGFFLIFNKKIKEFKTHNLFLILSIIFGIAFAVITPKTLCTSFDDQTHFSHSLNPFKKSEIRYSYAEEIVEGGTFVYEGSPFFETKEEKILFYRSLNKLHKESKNREVQVSNERDFYGNLVYLPFYIGYRVSNFLNLDFTICFVIGKLFNLILYSFLFYTAIKYAKYGKKVIFMIGMIPQCLFFATQYSYDSTIIAGLVLSTVCFVNLVSEEKVNKKYLIVFVLSALWASLPKALYCPFLLLLLFIPNKKFDTKKQAIIFKVLIVLLTILVLITFVLPTATGEMTADDRGDHASVSGQIKYILNNPFSFMKTLSIFTIKNAWEKTLSYKNFACLPYLIEMNTFSLVYYFYLIILLYYSFTSNISKEFNIKYKLLFGLEIIGIWLLFCVALYLKFTKVGLNSISGVQARYMLPLFAAIFYLFMSKKRKKNNNDYLYIVCSVLFISLVILYLSIKVV